MYLLIDECCPRFLVAVAQELGHTAQRTIEIAGLGRQASDAAIYAFACAAGAVIVTVNRGDFLALAARQPGHRGLILLPSVPPAATAQLFRSALRAAEQADRRAGPVIEVRASGSIRLLSA